MSRKKQLTIHQLRPGNQANNIPLSELMTLVDRHVYVTLSQCGEYWNSLVGAESFFVFSP